MYEAFSQVLNMALSVWWIWGPPFLIFLSLTVLEVLFKSSTKE